MSESVVLSYDDEHLPMKVRKLIKAEQIFDIEIRGDAHQELQPLLEPGSGAHSGKLALHPNLHPLMSVLMFARGIGRTTTFETEEEATRLSVR